MKIPKQYVFAFVIMLVGKACGYSEESIVDLVKFIMGFGIIVSSKFIIKKDKDTKEYTIKFSLKTN